MDISPALAIRHDASFDPEGWEGPQDGIHISRAVRAIVTFPGHRPGHAGRAWLSLTVPSVQKSQKIRISINDYDLGLCQIEPRIASAHRRFDFLLPSFLLADPAFRCVLLAESGRLRILEMVLEVEPPEHPDPAITDQEVMAKFASIGCDCEFGFAQRAIGIEPLGLLRFAGTRTLFNLIHHLKTGFSDVLEPGCFRADILGFGDHAEWFLGNVAGNYVFHTWQHPDSITRDAIIAQTESRVRYLVRSLIEDIEDGEKIFLYKSFEYLDHHEILALDRALGEYGRPKLFCVTRPVPGRPTGSLTQLSSHIVHGFFRGMLDSGQLGDRDGWLSLCHAAHRMFEGGMQEPLIGRTTKEAVLQDPLPNFRSR